MASVRDTEEAKREVTLRPLPHAPGSVDDEAFRAFSFAGSPAPIGAVVVEFGWPDCPAQGCVVITAEEIDAARRRGQQ